MDCKIIVINKSQIQKIKLLWEKLNVMHLNDSHYFKDHYKNFTFDTRCRKFNDISNDNIRIEIVEDNKTPVGYCISTIEKKVGEIDSLFIEEEYRKYGFGKQLIENSIKWLNQNNCKKILVAVAEGHESVFDYYKKFGFYPRMTYLQLRE